jgi:hypothetical protein
MATLAEFKTLDNLRVAEAFAQAVAEIRALTGWLLEQVCRWVALRGLSLGRWFNPSFDSRSLRRSRQ